MNCNKKKNEILKKYMSRGLTIEGINLNKVKNVKFNHLHEHCIVGLESSILYLQLRREIIDDCKKQGISLLSQEYKYKIKKLGDEIAKREENGELNLTAEHKRLLEILENLYYSCVEQDIPIKKLKIENGKVVVPKNQMYHACNLETLSQMESYADLGIVATEWFGVFESEGEARFCAFVKNDLRRSDFEGDSSQTEIRFYIDSENPLWQKLSNLDYFEYEHIKETTPEKIQELYPKDIIDLYDQIIEPLSAGGKNMHDNPNYHTYTWQAIPGGIPPQLIVGIQIGSHNKQLLEQIDEIQKLFPNAAIFDETHALVSQQKENVQTEHIL